MQYLLIVYILGCLLSYVMLKIDHIAEGNTYTNLHFILTVLFSSLSYLIVLFLLVKTWLQKINTLGYFNKPFNQKQK